MKKLLIAAGALMAGTAVFAQTSPVAPPAAPAPMARPMADKVMTRAEVVAMVRDHFARLDANQDGAVTTAEVAERRTEWAGHGKGTGGEQGRLHAGDPNTAFDRLDSNKDGAISRDEFAKGRQERIERRVEIREKRKEGAKDGKEGGRWMRMHRMGGFGGRMIVMADTNKDGRITLAEAETMALQHFDQMDTNRDGQVTPEERRAARPLMIKRMQAPSAG